MQAVFEMEKESMNYWFFAFMSHWQSISERRLLERRGSATIFQTWKTDERDRKLALIFCAHKSTYFY